MGRGKVFIKRIGGRVEEWKSGFGVCCLNARRIWANTPQIADYRVGL